MNDDKTVAILRRWFSVNLIIESLPNRDRDIMVGMLRGAQLVDEAKRLGCTKERVRQIRNKILRTLGAMLIEPELAKAHA